MAVTNAVETQTTILKRNGNAIGEVVNISGPSVKLGIVDATHLNSDNKFREKIGGLLDGGEVTFECNYYSGDAEQVGLLTDMYARTVQDWSIEFPTATGSIWTFTGLVTAYDPAIPLEGKVGFSATISISGMPSLGITASTNPTALAGIEENLDAALDLIPNFLAAGRDYSCDGVNTASTWVKITVTAAAANTITATALGVQHVLTTAVQSEAITIGIADTLTTITIVITDTGKSPVTIYLRVGRP